MIPTRAKGRPRRAVVCLPAVESLEERWLLDAGSLASWPSFPAHLQREEVLHLGGEDARGWNGPSRDGGALSMPPPPGRPDASHPAGSSEGRGSVTVSYSPVDIHANVGNAAAPAPGRDKPPPAPPVPPDPMSAPPPACADLAVVRLPPAADAGKADGGASVVPVAPSAAVVSPLVLLSAGNDGAMAPPTVRGDFVGAPSPDLGGELATALTLATPGLVDLPAAAAFFPQTANLLTEGVAVSAAALDRAIRDFVEPLRDAGGWLTGPLYGVGASAWVLAAALACASAWRLRQRRADGANGAPLLSLDLVPEADL